MDEQGVDWPGEWATPGEPVAPGRRWAGILCSVVGFVALAYFLNDLQYPLHERRMARDELVKIRQHVYAFVPAGHLAATEAALRDATFRLRVDGMLALLSGIALTGGWVLAKPPRE